MDEKLIFGITLAAIVAYFVPVALVLLRKFWDNFALRVFALYWVLAACINILSILPFIPARSLEIIYVGYNLIDIPLMLSLLFVTTRARPVRSLILISGMVIIFLQTAAIYRHGWYYGATKYTMGLGLVVVILILFWEIIRFFQKIIHSPQQKRMLFVYIALLFEYGGFIVVYVFDYFAVAENADTALVYYSASLVAMLIVTVGLLVKIKAPGGRFPSYAAGLEDQTR